MNEAAEHFDEKAQVASWNTLAYIYKKEGNLKEALLNFEKLRAFFKNKKDVPEKVV
eukprot:CAMPEP_0114579326 /NCGR_PEP_ID=MMETSP0125-20121206/3728_1 /TAXON_ID=485358 ORGANISM="Aristerostoma sp., Strain ATCC 50986" /NCGR_SAMPLE_ID=MMETSP0125 /ASSEMBLY_ACC=CAM_ASM_000245 /LENGTH=55 /DNA_ID=CAMNT_0001770009 /DNA_START=640 /DNA_END=807 /DNA_ORIENTATION=-